MTTPTHVCGVLFQESLHDCTDMSAAQIRVFAAGAIVAAAEKISLGGCPAAMFRPSPEYYKAVATRLDLIASRYGLWTHRLPKAGELWLYHAHVDTLISLLHGLTPNSHPWHALRALLCGIPAAQIDLNYHQREGFGLPCDRPQED